MSFFCRLEGEKKLQFYFMEEIALLFCSSRDTSRQSQQANLGVSRYQTVLDTPLAVDHQLEELFLSLKSFTFTNFFYNSSKSQAFYLGVEYSDYSNSNVSKKVYSYQCSEGYFDENSFQDEYNNFLINSKGDLPRESTLTLTELGYTGSHSDSYFPTTFATLQYTTKNGKFFFQRDPFSFKVREDEMRSYNKPFIPRKYIIELYAETYDLYDNLGIYRPGDNYMLDDNNIRQIEIPLKYKTISQTVGGVKYIKFEYDEVIYEVNYPCYLRPLDYIDLKCENVESTNYSSNSVQLSVSKTLARIPIMSQFGQTQTYIPQYATYVPVISGKLSSLLLTLEDSKNEVNMQKSPFLCEIVVSQKSMKDITNAEGNVNELRHLPPVTFDNRMTQDKLEFAQRQDMSSLQRDLYGENKQGMNKRIRRPYI